MGDGGWGMGGGRWEIGDGRRDDLAIGKEGILVWLLHWVFDWLVGLVVWVVAFEIRCLVRGALPWRGALRGCAGCCCLDLPLCCFVRRCVAWRCLVGVPFVLLGTRCPALLGAA